MGSGTCVCEKKLDFFNVSQGLALHERESMLCAINQRRSSQRQLAGGSDGMDFVRQLFKQAPERMSELAVLVLEIGNEVDHFITAFPELEVAWLDTSAGDDQVLLIAREALLTLKGHA